MEIACNWKHLRFSLRGKQRQRTKSPFQSMTLELLVFYLRPLFPNSHKHYWEIPMFTISFGVLQKLFINSIYTHPLFSNLIPIQNSVKVRRYLPLPMAPDATTDWLARNSTALHVWASFAEIAWIAKKTFQYISYHHRHRLVYSDFQPNTLWLSVLPKEIPK